LATVAVKAGGPAIILAGARVVTQAALAQSTVRVLLALPAALLGPQALAAAVVVVRGVQALMAVPVAAVVA
jgi:hypothetical protein